MVKHIVASGCSYTADGTGGVPPSHIHPDGGCSFIHADPPAQPNTWAGFVAQTLGVNSFINLAAGSHGNALISQTLIWALTHFDYSPKDTVVLFNISESMRLDIPCEWQHPDRSRFVDWPSDLIPYTYLDRSYHSHNTVFKHMGMDQVGRMSNYHLVSLFSFLESKGFRYNFVTMKNFTKDSFIGDTIRQYQHRMIKTDPLGFWEWSASRGQLASDGAHPNRDAHQAMAGLFLDQKY